MKKIPVIAVVGPTASGKTSLAVEIAKRYNGEVVSADSMQIYEKMNIATAKPTIDEMCGVPHHLIGFQSIDEKFSVAQYVSLATKCIDNITSRGKIAVLAGGTGLYVDSLLKNVKFAQESSNQVVRQKITDEFNKMGAEYMLNKLASIDKKSAEKLHINDKSRIIRALEIYEITGTTKSYRDEISMDDESPYNPIYIGINYRERNVLYDRINLRVDIMMKSGLLDESNDFYNISKDTTACGAIGYKELAPYFNGELSLQECVENLKKSTRHYAKRQLTWFRKNDDVNWIYRDDYENNQLFCNDVFKIIDKFLERYGYGTKQEK